MGGIAKALLGCVLIGTGLLSASGQETCPLSLTGGDAVSVGIYVAPLSSGSEPLCSYQASRLLTPASILKSLTAATALSNLGPDYRWDTRVLAVGEISGGTLHGDIVIQGSGDPTVDSRFFKDNYGFCEKVRSAVVANGINRVEGNIVVDGSRFSGAGVNPAWEVEDIGWDYGAGIYSFNYMDNAFAMQLPGLSTSPRIPGLEIETSFASGNEPIYVSRGTGSDHIRVGGSIGKRKSVTVWCSMPSPRRVVEMRLDSMLSAHSITVCHNQVMVVKDDTLRLVTHHSPRLSKVLRSLMVRSDNLMAEGALRALAPMEGRDGAVKAECGYWKSRDVDLNYTRILDGSGLARGNALSPRQLAEVLQIMASGKYAAEYVDLFPRAGLDGTLKTFMSTNRRKGEFMLKTGSMSGVQCYAGYRVNPSTGKPTHVIVIMINNLFGPRSEVRKAVERFLLELKF